MAGWPSWPSGECCGLRSYRRPGSGNRGTCAATGAPLVQERTREKQRAERLLDDTQIKLSSVLNDIFGKSGRDMLEALIAGQRDPPQGNLWIASTSAKPASAPPGPRPSWARATTRLSRRRGKPRALIAVGKLHPGHHLAPAG